MRVREDERLSIELFRELTGKYPKSYKRIHLKMEE